MKKLALQSLAQTHHLVNQPSFRDLSPESPALEVFSDLKHNLPLIMDMNTKAIDAEKLMKYSHSDLKLVVDTKGHFLGLISIDDLNEQEMMKHISYDVRRNDLLLHEFVKPSDTIFALNYGEIKRANIKDVVKILKESGQSYCLVTEQDGTICGIISAKSIAKKLNLSLQIEPKPNFASIFGALHH